MIQKPSGIKYAIARTISACFLLWYKIRYGSRVSFGARVLVNHRFRFAGKGKLFIGDDVNLWAHSEPNRFFTYNEKAVVSIGNKTRLNGVLIQCADSVCIGEETLVGSAIMSDTDMHHMDIEGHVLEGHVMVKPIVIGNRVWIGGQAALLKGVSLGDESVVAFRSVVVKDVPSKALVGGNPAKVLKKV